MGLDQGELDTVIGVGLDAVATFTGAVGKMLLRHAAVTGNMWFYPLGFFFTGFVDPVFDASAYSFAAASIVTACAGLVIVWTVILAPCYLREPLTQSRAASALLICAGTIGTGVFGNHVEVDRTVDEYLALFTRPAACAYYAVLALCLAVCLARRRAATEPQIKGFYLSAFAGLLAGNTFTTKACMEMLECVATHAAVSRDHIQHRIPTPRLRRLSLSLTLRLALSLESSRPRPGPNVSPTGRAEAQAQSSRRSAATRTPSSPRGPTCSPAARSSPRAARCSYSGTRRG